MDSDFISSHLLFHLYGELSDNIFFIKKKKKKMTIFLKRVCECYIDSSFLSKQFSPYFMAGTV